MTSKVSIRLCSALGVVDGQMHMRLSLCCPWYLPDQVCCRWQNLNQHPHVLCWQLKTRCRSCEGCWYVGCPLHLEPTVQGLIPRLQRWEDLSRQAFLGGAKGRASTFAGISALALLSREEKSNVEWRVWGILRKTRG